MQSHEEQLVLHQDGGGERETKKEDLLTIMLIEII